MSGDQIAQIAERMRGLREIEAVSAETLARELGVAAEEYVAYESGAHDIPVGVLNQVAQRFGVELTALLTGEEPHLHTYSLVRAGGGVKVQRHGDYDYESLAFNFIHARMEPFVVTVPPGPAEAPYHLNSHPGQEFDYVLEGTVWVMIDGHELTLETGDAVYLDAGKPHGMKACGEASARFLAVVI